MTIEGESWFEGRCWRVAAGDEGEGEGEGEGEEGDREGEVEEGVEEVSIPVG